MDQDLARKLELLASNKQTIDHEYMFEMGLSQAVAYGNSLPEMYLYRTVYDDNANYTISTTEHGPMEPNDVDPMPYVEKLTTGVSCEYTDDKAPDGEYVVLAFPDEEIRFDFFLAEGGENYVRYVSNTGDEEEREERLFMKRTII